MLTLIEVTEDRVLVLMPSPQDNLTTCNLLEGSGLTGIPCEDLDDVCRELLAGAGALLLTDEVMRGDGAECLSSILADQPSWSDIPVVLLSRERSETRNTSFREAVNATLVERPVRMRTLLSVIHSALRARRRQYEVRDYLAERHQTAEAIRTERERLRITLASIGDAVISTDADGHVNFMNGVAETLTGWTEAEARGQPLQDIFRIVNEHTRRAVENPAVRALQKGVVVGLANHTVLIARDGTERPIDDSAAPIRDSSGATVGAVLVFRDVTERKRAAETQSRLAAIVESSDDAIISKTLDGVIRSWNAGAERLFGYTAAEAVGQPITLIIPPEELDEHHEILNRLRRGAQIEHFETVRVAKDGRILNISLAISPIRDVEGRIIGASKVARDITQRTQAAAALRKSEERYRTLFESMTEGFCLIETLYENGQPVDYRFLEVNPAFESHTGLKDTAGRTIRELMRNDEAHWFEKVGRLAANSEPLRFISEANSKGRLYEVSTYRPGGPGSARTAILLSDITERKHAQEAMARDAMLLASVQDSVVVTDPSGIVNYWNAGATQLLGWTSEEMIGRHYTDWLPEPPRAFVAKQISERTALGEWCGEYEDYRKDGTQVWIDSRVSPVTDATGAMVGILAVSHDITERKRAEDALRDADRRKDEFIALLAHELRNPLAPIRNGLQVLQMGASDPNAVSQARMMMSRQLGHMVRLIDDLLDVSRIGRNKMELRRARVTLAEVIASAVETARPLIDSGGHGLLISLPPSPIYLDADLTRLAQVFGNLLSNSAKYTPHGGNIWLTAERRGNDAFISVRDDGIGIPRESLDKIFDMFSQVDRSIERSTGGLGIGLALVKGLVEMHGGSVSVECPEAGCGSTFTVRLPVLNIEADRTVRPSVQGEQRSASPKRRFLVVDDNRDAATSMAMMLRLFGHEVQTANDGLQAVEAAEQFRPDVILMDVGMPRLNGYEATRRIREQSWGHSVIIIALTGWGQDGDRAHSKDAGCNGHLVKPVNPTELNTLLSRLTAEQNGPDHLLTEDDAAGSRR